MKKSTKTILWILGALFVLVVIANLGETSQPTTTTGETVTTPGVNEKARERLDRRRDSLDAIERQRAGWNVHQSTDQVTGKTSTYAFSPRFGSSTQMEFPYTGTEMHIGFGCDSADEWLYLLFTNQPNLINDDTEDGYSLSSSRVRWDDTQDTVTLHQDWGSSALHFVYDAYAVEKMIEHSTMLIEFQWYGSGNVLWEIPLDGVRYAIGQAREKCRV